MSAARAAYSSLRLTAKAGRKRGLSEARVRCSALIRLSCAFGTGPRLKKLSPAR